MASTPVEVLNKVVENSVVDLRLVSARTLANLYNAGRVKTYDATTINWDVVVGGAGVSIEPVTQDGSDTPQDVTVPASITMGTHKVKYQFPISRIAIKEARRRAPQDLQDLFGTTITGGLIQLMRTINTLIWTGDGTPTSANIIGINKILDPTYAYAGVNNTLYPAWNALVQANGGTQRPLSRDMLLRMEKNVMIQETYYNYVTMHPNMGMAYTQLFDSLGGSSIFTNLPASAPYGQQGTESNGDEFKRVDLGHGNRYYNSFPIIEDPLEPDNQMVFMNMQDVELFTFDMSANPAANNTDGYDDEYAPVASSKVNGMNVHIAQLPSNNSTQLRFEMFVLPQLRVKNRKSLMVIKDLTSST